MVEEFEIFDSSGNVNVFTDEAYYLFCKKYKDLSDQRDVLLFEYMNSTPNLFRCHLPHSKWVYGVIFSVVWYYDELIVSDPVLQLIDYETGNLEEKKFRLQSLLSFLKRCRESIEGGYLLFAGDKIIPNKTGLFENESESLANTPEVLNAFEKISMMMKKPSSINENPNDDLTQLEVIYEGLWGKIRTMAMYIPPHVFNSDKLSNGVLYDFTSKYERLTKEELVGFKKTDLLDALKNEYRKDISIVLETIANAQRLNSPVLFYREADIAVAKNYALTTNEKNKIADTTIYDCLVPYITDIPPERLFYVRNQIPEAFKEFRAFLFELVTRTMKSTDNPVELKYKIDSEMNSMMRKLNIEMNNAKRKWNFHGVAAPLILLTGSLSFYSSGIDFSKLLTPLLGTGGIIKTITTWSDVISDKRKASVNPVYFLWEAQKGNKT